MLGASALHAARGPQNDPRLKGAFRKPKQSGWTYVHLEGTPAEIGFQHGWLLAAEIREAQQVTALELTHDARRPWSFFRESAQTDLWPRIEKQYREELEGIQAGAAARGVHMDLWDVVAHNAWLEWPYFINWDDRTRGMSGIARMAIPERCSAFVATGGHTRDGRIVMGHNAWTGYLDGSRWNLMFDVAPASGNRFLMDGFPGLIHSGDDFSVTSGGLLITETTISRFNGWRPEGIPEFVRARKAMQYASSIDEFEHWMREGNNGGYANNWLVGDRKTGEIASLELGLKYVTLRRSKDGYFAGANFPVDGNLTAEETEFSPEDASLSPNARRARWDELMAENKGKIDVPAGQRFLGDHYDTYDKRVSPSERTLCGHIDLSPRGLDGWQPKYGIAGTVQNKVADSELAERMELSACMGHSCGISFRAAAHLKAHPEFDWQKPLLKDLPSHGWASFRSHMG